MPKKTAAARLTDLDTFREKDQHLNVIIETPKHSRNKIDYDPELGIFELRAVLPEGSSFPYDFGFIPSTLGEDGDPLDALVLLDEPVPCGCLVAARLIGVIHADQTEKGKTNQNNRLLAVAVYAHTHEHVKNLDDLRPGMLDEIEQFFISYNKLKDRVFKPTGRGGPEDALHQVEEGQQAFAKDSK